jgi:hypothetical protein
MENISIVSTSITIGYERRFIPNRYQVTHNDEKALKMLIDYFYQNRYHFFIRVFSVISRKNFPLITLIPQINSEVFYLILVVGWY